MVFDLVCHMIMNIAKIIASGFYTGYVPVAPGTFGSLFGAVLVYLINFILVQFVVGSNIFITINLILIVLVYLIGVWSIGKVHQEWKHDDKRIVIDEIVGVWISLIVVPFKVKYYLLAFLVFRFFDILKPLGIKKIDGFSSNISVMLDDVLAGFYSMLVVFIIVYYRVI